MAFAAQPRQIRLRIAHVLPSLALGGKERIVVDLARRAHARGDEPLIITYDPVGDKVELDARELKRVEIDRALDAQSFTSKLAQTIKVHGIDLLHAHGHVAAVYAAPAARVRPVLATMHLSPNSDWRWAIPILCALRRVDRLTAVSHDLAQRFSRLTRRPVAVVPPGLDISSYKTPGNRGAGDRLKIGMAARLHPVKRHADAIEAVRHLESANVPVTLFVAGDGPLLSTLQEQSRGLPVKFLGPVADMIDFYQSVDVFLLCSDHEGTPMALLEAMASGLPCIVTDVGGIGDVVTTARDEPCALMVPKRCPRAIAATVIRLAREPALSDSLGKLARVRAACFSLEAQEQAYSVIYDAMISAARAR